MNFYNPFISRTNIFRKLGYFDQLVLREEINNYLDTNDLTSIPSYNDIIEKYINRCTVLSSSKLELYQESYLNDRLTAGPANTIYETDKILIAAYPFEDSVLAFLINKETKILSVEREIFSYVVDELLEDTLKEI